MQEFGLTQDGPTVIWRDNQAVIQIRDESRGASKENKSKGFEGDDDLQ
jgi:hypothetical protein